MTSRTIVLLSALSIHKFIYFHSTLFSTIKAHNQQLVEDPIHSQIRWRNWIDVKRFIVAICDTPLAGSLVAVENRPALLSKI